MSDDRRELIGIDAGTRRDSAKPACEALQAHTPNLPELTTVFITHSHWDHASTQGATTEKRLPADSARGVFDKQFFGKAFQHGPTYGALSRTSPLMAIVCVLLKPTSETLPRKKNPKPTRMLRSVAIQGDVHWSWMLGDSNLLWRIKKADRSLPRGAGRPPPIWEHKPRRSLPRCQSGCSCAAVRRFPHIPVTQYSNTDSSTWQR